MKQIIFIVMVLGLSLAVHAQEKEMTRKERKAKTEAEKKEHIVQLISDKTWRFEAERMLPASGSGKTLVTDYGVDFHTDRISSYLPFYGRAYKADYGSNRSPMDFESEIDSYHIQDWAKGGWIVNFNVKNKSDFMQFTFTIASSGSATLSVNSTDRVHISFQGEITDIRKEK